MRRRLRRCTRRPPASSSTTSRSRTVRPGRSRSTSGSTSARGSQAQAARRRAGVLLTASDCAAPRLGSAGDPSLPGEAGSCDSTLDEGSLAHLLPDDLVPDDDPDGAARHEDHRLPRDGVRPASVCDNGEAEWEQQGKIERYAAPECSFARWRIAPSTGQVPSHRAASTRGSRRSRRTRSSTTSGSWCSPRRTCAAAGPPPRRRARPRTREHAGSGPQAAAEAGRARNRERPLTREVRRHRRSTRRHRRSTRRHRRRPRRHRRIRHAGDRRPTRRHRRSTRRHRRLARSVALSAGRPLGARRPVGVTGKELPPLGLVRLRPAVRQPRSTNASSHSQRRAVPSSLAVAKWRPSGLTATPVTLPCGRRGRPG